MPCRWFSRSLFAAILAWEMRCVTAPTGFSFASSAPAQAFRGADTRNSQQQQHARAHHFKAVPQLLLSIGSIAAGAHVCVQVSSSQHARKNREQEHNESPVSASDGDDSDSDECDSCSSESECSSMVNSDQEPANREETRLPSHRNGKASSGKLWSTDQFPEGIKGAANWDLLNLSKAQEWRCPCTDRSYLSQERYPKVDPLYDFRKSFQTTSRKRGLRDTFRKRILEPAYSPALKSFSRSVRIGDLNNNCVVAAGLAAGLSFATFANARSDVTKDRPYHGGRVQQRDKLASQERQTINNYIVDLRTTMEGDKGGQRHDVKWHTGRRSGDHVHDCIEAMAHVCLS